MHSWGFDLFTHAQMTARCQDAYSCAPFGVGSLLTPQRDAQDVRLFTHVHSLALDLCVRAGIDGVKMLKHVQYLVLNLHTQVKDDASEVSMSTLGTPSPILKPSQVH